MISVYGGISPTDILRKYKYFFINGFYYIFTMLKTISAMTVCLFILCSLVLAF